MFTILIENFQTIEINISKYTYLFTIKSVYMYVRMYVNTQVDYCLPVCKQESNDSNYTLTYLTMYVHRNTQIYLCVHAFEDAVACV